jgi:hypothetical protein
MDVAPCLNGCTRRHVDGTRHPVRVEQSARICGRCVDRLDTWLREIPDHFDRLPGLLEHGSLDVDARTGRRADAAAPMRLDIVDLLDTRPGRHRRGTVSVPAEDCRGALGALAGWVKLVAEKRRPGRDARIIMPTGGVRGFAEYLLRHLDWISEQVWVDDFTTEVHKLRNQLAYAVGIRPPLPVGRCTAVVDGEYCGGPLWPDHARGRCEGESSVGSAWRFLGGVHCGSCGDRWSSATLARLGAGLPLGQAS